MLIDSARPAPYARPAVRQIGGVAVPMCLAVVRGDADAYLHAGGASAADGAALAPVARAAGLHVSELAPSPGGSAPDLVICRPQLAAPLLAAARRHRGGEARRPAGEAPDRRPAPGRTEQAD